MVWVLKQEPPLLLLVVVYTMPEGAVLHQTDAVGSTHLMARPQLLIRHHKIPAAVDCRTLHS